MNELCGEALISVIVPVYNVGGSYLSRCLDSIIKQRYKFFEIIIVYDESEDDSGIVCSKYAEKYSCIRMLYNKNRRGISKARNIGINESHGEYITFVDGDDWIDEDYLQDLVEPLIKDSTIDVSIEGCIRCFDTGVLIKRSPVDDAFDMDREMALKHLLQRKLYDWVIWGKLYRKKIFDTYRFSDDLTVGEDFDGTWHLFHIAKRFHYTGKSGYYYCVRYNSLSHSDGYFDGHMMFFRSFSNIMNSYNAHKNYEILGLIRNCFCEGVYGILKKGLYREDVKKEDIEQFYNEFAVDMRSSINQIDNEWIRGNIEKQFRNDFSTFMSLHVEKLNRLKEASFLYIFGAGDFAKCVAENFNRNGISFKGFIVSDNQPVGDSPDGLHKMLHLKDVYDIEEAWIYISLSIRFCIEVFPKLGKVANVLLW